MNASQSPCLVSSPSLMMSRPAARCSATTQRPLRRRAASVVLDGIEPGRAREAATCVVTNLHGIRLQEIAELLRR